MLEQTKKCPFCAEEILFEAIKCKHCGEMLVRKESPPEQSGESSGMKTLGGVILIIGLAIGLYFWIFFDASVEVPRQEIFGQVIGGGRVNNIGLLQEKQTGTFVGLGAAALGLILVLVGASKKSVVQTPTTQTITCPECKQSEVIPLDKLYDIAQYKKFSADIDKTPFGAQMLILKCKNCEKQFRGD